MALDKNVSVQKSRDAEFWSIYLGCTSRISLNVFEP